MQDSKNRWWQFKKMDKKDYGRFAIFALILAALKSVVQVQLPVLLMFLADILIFVGLISGVIWIIKSVRQEGKKI